MDRVYTEDMISFYQRKYKCENVILVTQWKKSYLYQPEDIVFRDVPTDTLNSYSSKTMGSPRTLVRERPSTDIYKNSNSYNYTRILHLLLYTIVEVTGNVKPTYRIRYRVDWLNFIQV